MPPAKQARRHAAERWFLARGLPAVLRPGALLRRVWSRSAPAVAGIALVAANSMLVVALTGKHTIDIDGRPDLGEGVVLASLVLVPPVAVLMGWLVSRIGTPVRRVGAANLSLAVIVVGAIFGGPSHRIVVNLVISAVTVAVVVVLTAGDMGAILG